MMLQKGRYARFGRDIVVILSVNGNEVFYKSLTGYNKGGRANGPANQFIPLNPVEERQIREKAARTRYSKPIVKPVPAVDMPKDVCPECGAQNYVVGVHCPNCDFLAMESFRAWLDRSS